MPRRKPKPDKNKQEERPPSDLNLRNHSATTQPPIQIWQHQPNQQQNHQQQQNQQYLQQPNFPLIHQYQNASNMSYQNPNMAYLQPYEFHNPSHIGYQTLPGNYPMQPIPAHRHPQFGSTPYALPVNTNSSANNNTPQTQIDLLQKFEVEVMQNITSRTVSDRLETQTRAAYMHHIRSYIMFCVNKRMDNFYVTYSNAKEFILGEVSNGVKITEGTIKNVTSALNLLQEMNKIVYGDKQSDEALAGKLIREILNSLENQCPQPSMHEGGRTTATKLSSEQASDWVNLEKTFFKLSEVSKHRLSEGEVLLLKKFDNEVIESEKTTAILENLTENTFKSYSTDIKRFIKFCARQGRDNFLLEPEILTKFIKLEFNQKKNKLTSTRLRNLRSSLLKLHQLNSLAYDIEYSEGQVVYLINKFLDNIEGLPNFEESDQDKLLSKLQTMCDQTTLLSGLSDGSRKLYFNEYSRYAMFCSREGYDHFHLTGDLIKKFFINDIIGRKPNFSGKKLQEILSRLNRLHSINAEVFPGYPSTIPDIHLVKDFLKEYKKSTMLDGSLSSSSSTISTMASTTDPSTTPVPTYPPAVAKQENSFEKKRPRAHPVVSDTLSVTQTSESFRDDEKEREIDGRPDLKRVKSKQSASDDQIPRFVMNRNIQTVTQLVEEWYSILQRNSRYGQGWIQSVIDFELFNNRKLLIDLIEQLLQEVYNKNITDQDYVYDVAKVFDDYMDRKHIGLDELINKVRNYSVYTKREFLRILTNRKK